MFKLEKANWTVTVLVDRLKPAHIDLDNPVVVAEPRRRGRFRLKKKRMTRQLTLARLIGIYIYFVYFRLAKSGWSISIRMSVL